MFYYIPHPPSENLVNQEWGPQAIILFDAKWNKIFEVENTSKFAKIFDESRFSFSRKFREFRSMKISLETLLETPPTQTPNWKSALNNSVGF